MLCWLLYCLYLDQCACVLMRGNYVYALYLLRVIARGLHNYKYARCALHAGARGLGNDVYARCALRAGARVL